jgi:hypothetical protein
LDATTRARLTWLDWLDWLREGGGTQGAWESTGEYGKPGSYLLEEPAELLRVNLQHVKNGPGRKTEGKDAEGRAALLRQGLVQGSFVPGRPPREWRDLTRGRCPLIEERTRIVIRKTLLPFDSKLPEPAPLTRI